MTDDDWGDWAARHASLFSMLREEDREMFRQWRVEFEAMEFTAPELHVATDFISREAVGLTRWDHLQAIRDNIRRHRSDEQEKLRREMESRADVMGTCDLCGDTGVVCGLPHLKQITVEGWAPLVTGVPPYTCGAICTCIRGKWQLDAWDKRSAEYKEKHKRSITLAEYTRVNSQWKAQLREFAELRKKQRENDAAADKLSKLKARPANQKGLDELANTTPQVLEAVKAVAPVEREPGAEGDDSPWPTEVPEYEHQSGGEW